MTTFIFQRLLLVIPTLFLISIAVFTIIQLPPGDYLTILEAELAATGGGASTRYVESMRQTFGFDQPLYVQYFLWLKGVLQGNFGFSFEYQRPVLQIVAEPLLLSFAIALLTVLFTWIVAIPIGIYSATHRYSWGDNVSSFLAFLGLATPNFLFALALLVAMVYVFNSSYTGGLFSPVYEYAPWSFGKVIDFFKHVWAPVLVVGTAGTAELMRIMRGNLADILQQQYIKTARAKGLKERSVVLKHSVRVAVNPLISIAGVQLPQTMSSETITAIVLGLPTAGPLLYRALLSQDMFLAGTVILFMTVLLVLGNLLADIALAAVDPRIRYD